MTRSVAWPRSGTEASRVRCPTLASTCSRAPPSPREDRGRGRLHLARRGLGPEQLPGRQGHGRRRRLRLPRGHRGGDAAVHRWREGREVGDAVRDAAYRSSGLKPVLFAMRASIGGAEFGRRRLHRAMTAGPKQLQRARGAQRRQVRGPRAWGPNLGDVTALLKSACRYQRSQMSLVFGQTEAAVHEITELLMVELELLTDTVERLAL